MSPGTHGITLSEDVALVLSELLSEASSDGAIRPQDSADQRALSDLLGALQRALPAVDGPEELERLRGARARLSSGAASSTTPAPPVAYVDVDDTLVRSFGSKRIPIQRVVDRVAELHAAGVELYCWSSGGARYAHRSAVELGLAGCFLGFLPKPKLLVDDQPFGAWRGLRCLHPNEAASLPLDELVSRG